jgi:hypothetical protein
MYFEWENGGGREEKPRNAPKYLPGRNLNQSLCEYRSHLVCFLMITGKKLATLAVLVLVIINTVAFWEVTLCNVKVKLSLCVTN